MLPGVYLNSCDYDQCHLRYCAKITLDTYMADPPALPDGSSPRYNELFSALPNDDARRGYLLYNRHYDGNMRGAARLSRGWNKLTPTAQQEYINRATSGAINHASDRGIESGGEESSRNDLQEAINGGRIQAEPGAPEDNVPNIEDPLHGVATPAEANNPEASNETEKSDYELSYGEIAIARVGLTEADTGRAAPPQTRKRGREEVHDHATQEWQWCKTLMDSRTRFSGSRKMRTVVCLYVLCDETGRILKVSIFINPYFAK